MTLVHQWWAKPFFLANKCFRSRSRQLSVIRSHSQAHIWTHYTTSFMTDVQYIQTGSHEATIRPCFCLVSKSFCCYSSLEASRDAEVILQPPGSGKKRSHMKHSGRELMAECVQLQTQLPDSGAGIEICERRQGLAQPSMCLCRLETSCPKLF